MIPLRYSLILAAALGLLAACSDNTDSPETSTAAETATTETPSAIAPSAPEAAPAEVTPEREAFNVIEVARFDSP